MHWWAHGHWTLEVRFDYLVQYPRSNSPFYRHPTDNAHTKDRLEYYLWLAKLAEKGKITAIFFADAYAGMFWIDESGLSYV
jgi:alkanesulfonate monooxygenase SsuD/methylene tetrahydromethanopterin reductase-like flavin-dependent oxidoreductase (luciferase family)